MLRCHIKDFEHFGGALRKTFCDRMKTAVLGEHEAERAIVYNAKLLAYGAHYGFVLRTCQASGRRRRARSSGRIATSTPTSAWRGASPTQAT